MDGSELWVVLWMETGERPLAPPAAKETDCCEERIADYCRPRQYSETRPYRVQFLMDHVSAAISSAVRSRTEDCYEHETEYYASRDPWYTQSQSNRPCLNSGWGTQMTVPRAFPVMSAMRLQGSWGSSARARSWPSCCQAMSDSIRPPKWQNANHSHLLWSTREKSSEK